MDYSLQEDVKLLQMVSNGDMLAENCLLDRYKNLVKIKARTYFLAGGDNDDLIQEGMIGLFKAIRDFKYDKEASFKTFANLCISRQIQTAIKAATRQKHSPLNSAFSLHTESLAGNPKSNIAHLELSMSHKSNPEEVMINKENKLVLEEQIGKKLSKFEKEVLFFYLSGENYIEISKIIGKDEKSIDNALQRIRKKISLVIDKK